MAPLLKNGNNGFRVTWSDNVEKTITHCQEVHFRGNKGAVPELSMSSHILGAWLQVILMDMFFC